MKDCLSDKLGHVKCQVIAFGILKCLTKLKGLWIVLYALVGIRGRLLTYLGVIPIYPMDIMTQTLIWVLLNRHCLPGVYFYLSPLWLSSSEVWSVSPSAVSDSLWPRGPSRTLSPWNSPGEHAGVGGHFLLRGVFPTQGSMCLLHRRQTLSLLSHQGSPVV